MSVISKLLIILDGLADEPIDALNTQTPLQAAQTPNLDYLATLGQSGIADPTAPHFPHTTATCTLGILGYPPGEKPVPRGIVEALGTDLELEPGDVAWRGNWATVDENGFIIDRRAGRIREGVEELVNSLNQMRLDRNEKLFVRSATEHRFALIIRGQGLSDKIVSSDPIEERTYQKKLIPHALDPADSKAQRTAQLLRQFEDKAEQILKNHPLNVLRQQKGQVPVTGILTREAGMMRSLPPIHINNQLLNAACVTGDRTIFGLCKMTGMDVLHAPEMTANLDSNLALKFEYATQVLRKRDLVVLHIKGCDIAAHNQDALRKMKFIEEFDLRLGHFLAEWKEPLRIAVTTDHSTSSITGHHMEGPVPVLLYGSHIEADQIHHFDEVSARQGSLGYFQMWDLLKHLCR
ncbi:MAG: 2,3-bisphosphoglycerate-independent phosphoglycerate mutase [SAR324 cluster bacterium]|nr:2,3-bisphosphoglycerate-independent phosphoglycerate mutase [SAR324 cluster bacterium]